MIIKPFLIIKSHSRGISYRVTKSMAALDIDEIAIRLEITVPDALFQKPMLEAKINIPKEAVVPHTIEAETINNVENLIEQSTGFKVKLVVATEE